MSKRPWASPIPVRQRNAYAELVAKRREYVATLRNKLYTQPQILDTMADPTSDYYIENPQTGKPFSMGTIFNDLAFLKEQSIENAKKEFEEYKALQLAEIREARRLAWQKPTDLKMVAKFMELEMKLTGTIDSAVTYQLNQQNNLFVNEHGEPKDVRDLTDDQLLQIAARALPDDEVIDGELVEETD